MKRKAIALLLALLIPASIALAQDGETPLQPGDTPAALTADARALGDSITVLGLDLQKRLGGGNGNLVFSPLSIATALAAVGAGARGVTAAEMASVLHFPRTQAALHPAFGALLEHLGGRHPCPPALRTRMWVQTSQTILPEFAQTLRTQYSAEAIAVDFQGHPEVARAEMNAWVRQGLGRDVPDLLPFGRVSELTRLYVLSCVDFGWVWKADFGRHRATPEPFHFAAGVERSIPTMYAELVTGIADAPLCEIVELPYLPGSAHDAADISLIIVLPRDQDGLVSLQRTLSADSLRAWLSPPRLCAQTARIYLPTFNVAFSCDLPAQLVAMGMKSAFSEGTADFSGIDGDRDLCLGYLPHHASIDVGLEGTRATAATAVEVRVSGVVALAPIKDAPRVVRINHPFMFLLFDKMSGCSLFQGRVVDPESPGPAH